MTSNIKYISLLTLGLLMALGVILFDFFYKIDPQKALDISLERLEMLYQKDSILIADTDGILNYLDEIESSNFNISIRNKADSLLYWNRRFAEQPEDYTIHWKRTFIKDSIRAEFSLDLFNGTRLDLSKILPEDYLPRYEYVYNKKGRVVVPIQGNKLNLSVSNTNLKAGWYNLILICWYLSLLLISLVLFKVFISDKEIERSKMFNRFRMNPFFAYMGILILYYIGSGYIMVEHIFKGHSLTAKSILIPFELNLLTFTSIMFLAYFIVEGLKHSVFQKNWHRQNVIQKYLFGSLIANGFLFFAVKVAEQLISKSVVFINIEEILNMDYCTMYFVLVMLGYCLVYFYLTSLLYRFKNNASGKPWQRALGHTLGLMIVAGLYLSQGLSTPIVPLTLFLLAYFLIQDLYEELKARNLTFVLINMILFSAFLSVVIFYSALRNNKFDRLENITNVVSILSKEQQSEVKLIRDSLIGSNLIPSIASLAYPSPMDRNELMEYVDNLINQIDSTSSFRLEGLECYDQLGNSLFFNHISNFQKNNETIVNSRKIDNNIFHLPLNSVTTIFYQIENNDFPQTPINLIIKLSKKSWKSSVLLEDKNYLIYKNNNLIYSFSNEFIDIDKLDPSTLEESKDIGEMSYVVYMPDATYKIIDYQEVSGLVKPISFFSLIFILCAILIGLFTLFNARLKILPEELDFTFYSQSSLRSKIQLSVILLILFSFFVIGIITTVYFKNIVSFNDRSKFKSELKTIINDVQNKLTETIDAESVANIITQEFSELENIYGRRFAFYNNTGEQIVKSSRYDDAFNLIPYKTLVSFLDDNETSIKSVSQELDEEQVLIPIYLKDNVPQGYLTMHYSSSRSISSGIYNHLGNLLNVYIFLFFLAGAISIFIANSITEPLARLREGVKKFKLGKSNEKLKYDSSDELGVLIQEYNNMTDQLEQSANIIAKTERDMAWREMAKQVAHEIKNPLTPMKLHIQHLENTARTSPEKAQDMIKKVASTLIEQIDNLSNIASEFSNYATLPKAENNKTNLNEVVEHVHDLFREREDMDINMNEPIDDLIVFADRNHLVRIFVNIVKNAIQSIPQDRRGDIEISLERVEDQAKVTITDNGGGIPDAMKNKIFTPNFTTKSSGTGLGLAICVNMLDTMNGKITFESQEGIGTTFCIEIPIMRFDPNNNDGSYL